MKKIFLFSLLLISTFAITACGKKEDKHSDTPSEIETEMTVEPETVPNTIVKEEIRTEREVNALPEVETTPESEIIPESEVVSTVAPEPETETEAETETESNTETETEFSESSEPSEVQDTSQDQTSEDDTITINQETLVSVLEDYKETLDALDITVEEITDFLGDEDIVVTKQSLEDGSFLQEKLLEYLDTLSLSEKLELLSKLANLMNE